MKVVAWVLGTLAGMLALGFVLALAGLIGGPEWSLGLFTAVLVGLLVAVEQHTGPRRDGEALDDFRRRRRRLKLLRRSLWAALGSLVAAGLSVVGLFVLAMNSYADNK